MLFIKPTDNKPYKLSKLFRQLVFLLAFLLPAYLYFTASPSNMSALKAVIVQPKTKHVGTVIWGHGLGDTGHGWSFLAEQLGSTFPGVKWLFPHAENRPITLNGGYKM